MIQKSIMKDKEHKRHLKSQSVMNRPLKAPLRLMSDRQQIDLSEHFALKDIIFP